MKVTFPHMGYSTIAFDMLLKDLGHETIMPPRPSKRTLDLGVQYSPEFACIPFKVLTGTYLETVEMGAEMAITSGGVGPCRAGYYGVLHQRILDDLGYKMKILVLEPPLVYKLDFLKKMNIIKPRSMSWRVMWQVVKKSWAKLGAIDVVEKRSFEVRPFEVNKGDTTQAIERAIKLLDAAQTVPDIEEAREEGLKIINAVPRDDNRRPLKIGVIGEIYVVLEPAVNYELMVTLGEMGVLGDRSIYLTQWTKDNALNEDGEENAKQAAQPYLSELIGGHGINSVGETVLYARHGFDGVIQLAPFSCIPEIVAKGILPRVSRECGIPVLTIFIDEQTGKAGVQTRLEAFIDLLVQRRDRRWRESETLIQQKVVAAS